MVGGLTRKKECYKAGQGGMNGLGQLSSQGQTRAPSINANEKVAPVVR